MSEPQDLVSDGETTTAQTGPTGDARLDRLLHDLDVANDTHPAHHGQTDDLDAADHPPGRCRRR